MAKKDFTNSSKAIDALAAATADTATEKKAPAGRINLAFYDAELYQFITLMARVNGKTITSFVNQILNDYMADHRDSYEKAIAFINSLERK